MTQRRIRATSDFFIKDLYTAVKSWMEYHFEINQQYVLSEDSIKIPICDYLTPYQDGIVEFEKKIDCFKKRHYDLYFKIREKEYFFEFKYVNKDYTCTIKEIKRYFADVARLKAKASTPNTECYLLVCGSKKDFLDEFMGENLEQEQILYKNVDGFFSENPPPSDEDTDEETDEETAENAVKIYNKMFAFGEGKEKTFDFEDDELNVFKNEFKSNYKLTNQIEYIMPHFFDSFFNFKTTCVALFCDGKDSYRTALGLWKVDSSEEL